MLTEAALKLGYQRAVQLGRLGLAARDMLHVNHLTIITRLSRQITQKGRCIHYQPRLTKRENLNLIVQYLYIKATVDDKIHHPGQHFVGMPPIIAHATNPKGG